MTALTGRTPSEYIRFIIGDTSDVLREIGVRSIGPVGLTYPEVDLSDLQDAVDGFASGRPGFELEFGGTFSTKAAVAIAASGEAAAAKLSGSQIVLAPLAGLMTPRSWAILVGIQAPWETGAPVFGISKSAANGVWVSRFLMVPGKDDLMFTSRIRMVPGSAVPTWGTSIIT